MGVPTYDKRLAVLYAVCKIAAALPKGAIRFGTAVIVKPSEAAMKAVEVHKKSGR